MLSVNSQPLQSIAILPFVDMSAEKDQDYFCDGVTEEIIGALTRLKGLRVASRTSVFQYKGRSTDVRKIGADLKVDVVLEGGIRKSGDRLRITAQLINVADGFHIWSERFDREANDVFEVQDAIA